jgi:acetamidase/formamidase
MTEHVIDPTKIHHAWDNSLEPTLRIASGDVVHFDLLMAGHRQVERGWTFAQTKFDFDTMYNLLGPIHVEGARPGNTLEVEILSLVHGDWGWTTVAPNLGLLPEDFPDPFVRYFDLTRGDTTQLVPGVEIPIEPFLGTMGIHADLMQGAKTVVRGVIQLIVEEHGLSREDAYVLCSVAGDLKILEIVDAQVWNVGFTLPRAVFTSER